ncbi:MAG: NADH-quinone oxidoreductase subunit L [Planctomycetes bacterium]|nr:NADH-quinone oxidoreductase subunit L [Planctomycetota bacterium]
MVSEASFTLNSLYPEQSVGFPIQTALALACFVLPLLGFFIQVLIGKKLPRQGDWLPTGAMGLAFLCAIGICAIHLTRFDPNYAVEWRVNWMDIRGDGHEVAHTETNLARLHLGEALIAAGYIDDQGKVTKQLEVVEDAAKATPEIRREVDKPFPAAKIAGDSYLASLIPMFAMTEEQARTYEREPMNFFRKRVLDYLDDSDGKKRSEYNAQFDDWFSPKMNPDGDSTLTVRKLDESRLTADAKVARAVMANWAMDPKNAQYMNVNTVDALANAFTIGVYIDNFTAIMLFMVTLLSFLIHLFSTGYMQGEVRYGRFFATINLFTAGMIGLVISNNFLWLFVCWEIMGLCSYLLIGHYFEKPSAQAASVKAFITTRIGDVFMFVGMMIIFFNAKTLLFTGPTEYQTLFKGWQEGAMDGAMQWGLTTYGGPGSFFAIMGSQAALLGGTAMTIIGVLLFIGPVGKSAQFPLHVWLPDAMEGPTPVSAMIHAACMVSAGVYLTARLFPIFTPDALTVIAFTGGFTALFAGTIGLVQTDIKKVLAYSTISQLGYMFLGIGCGAWVPAVFHMLTHAFFKALMFLGSGSVILGCHHEQEMTRMGGLWKKMPITAATFWIGNLAITGAPFLFSGFYSKEAVLTQANIFGLEAGGVMLMPYIFGALGAGLTTFYMFRLVWMTFHGKPRDKWIYEHAKESPWNVVLPLIVIAGFATVVGWPLMSKGDVAVNLNFTNVVEFGLLAFFTIVLGLMAGLYIFRRWNNAVKSKMWNMAAWTALIGLPVWFVLHVVGGYLGQAPMTTNAGPSGEQVANIDADGHRVEVRQADHEDHTVPKFVKTTVFAELEEIRKTAREADKEGKLAYSDEEIEALRAGLLNYYSNSPDKVTAVLNKARQIAAAKGQKLSEIEEKTILRDGLDAGWLGKLGSHLPQGRPNADGQSWFYYLIQKPRTCYSKDFLLDDARFDAKKVEYLYLGEDGHGLFADSESALPSVMWGARYNEWRAKSGLPLDPAYPPNRIRAGEVLLAKKDAIENKGHATRRFEQSAYVSAGATTIQHHEEHPAPHAAEHPANAGHGADAHAATDAHASVGAGHGDHDTHSGEHAHAHDVVTHEWHEKHHKAHLTVFAGSMIAFLIGLALSMFFFSPWGPFYMKEWIGHVGFKHAVKTFLKRAYMMDALYYGTVVKAQVYIMKGCAWFDKTVVDGLVNVMGRLQVWKGFAVAKIDFWGVDGTVRGVSNATGYAGHAASKAPTGKISDYVFMLIAAIVLLFIALALLS